MKSFARTLALLLALALVAACDVLTPPPDSDGDPGPPPPGGGEGRIATVPEPEWIVALDHDLPAFSVQGASGTWARSYLSPEGRYFLSYLDGPQVCATAPCSQELVYVVFDADGQRVAGPELVDVPNATQVRIGQFTQAPDGGAVLYGRAILTGATNVVYLARVDRDGHASAPRTFALPEGGAAMHAVTLQDGSVVVASGDRVLAFTASLDPLWSADVDHYASFPLVTVGADGAIYLAKRAVEGGSGGSRLQIYALDPSTGARLAPPQLAPGPNPADTTGCVDDPMVKDEILGGLVAPRDGRILMVTSQSPQCGEPVDHLVLTWYDPTTRTFEREEHHVTDLHGQPSPSRMYYAIDAQLTEDDELVLSWPSTYQGLVWHLDPEEPTLGWYRNLNLDVSPGIMLAETVAYHPDFGYFVGGTYVDGGDVLAPRYLFVARYDH